MWALPDAYGKKGSNISVYEVNQLLWQFGRGKSCLTSLCQDSPGVLATTITVTQAAVPR